MKSAAEELSGTNQGRRYVIAQLPVAYRAPEKPEIGKFEAGQEQEKPRQDVRGKTQRAPVRWIGDGRDRATARARE